MKKLLAVAAIIAIVFVGGYFAYVNFLAPRPVADVQSTGEVPSTDQLPANHPPIDQQAAPTGAAPMPTIVTAAVNKDGIPLTLSTLALQDSQMGKDALDMLAQMHGEGFDLVNGYRASYANSTNKATLYVGQAKDAATATKLASDMAAKIGTGNPMFTDLVPLNISGRTIYQVTGQGQLHFFYAINDKLVWLAIDQANAADGLHSIWGAIK